MKPLSIILLLATVAQAHYHFNSIRYNGKNSSKFEYIRQLDSNLIDGPEVDVYGPNMTCNRMANNPFNKSGTKTLDVTAGSTIDFFGYLHIIHQGPLQFWLAKAPSGTKVEDFDGLNNTWFKISSDEPSIVNGRIAWPNFDKNLVSVKIPECIEDGEYLLRVEHIGLHVASFPGGAQFYMSCAQIRVTGGTGTYKPMNLLAFPGSYDAKDPSILIHIFYPVPTNYTAPGGPVMRC
ncbi:glycoside hydrolase [Dendryphion nanum]|uniref:lytic cellulose monooxygenase (C4-dehydrogenating) n=1 Tax=Dendryphion nanum TaxID=256645 RepID=A0A9P9E280_9PLEO|nr:glycoside hydrolase [Dendryphion nanum]